MGIVLWGCVSNGAPCTTGRFFDRFFSDALFEIGHREELIDDLDAELPSGFTGLQLHLSPLAEIQYPKQKWFRLRFWEKLPVPPERLSTRHLALSREIAERAAKTSELYTNLDSVDPALWTGLYDCIDTVARAHLTTMQKDFDELVLTHYARPTPWVVHQVKALYVKIWMLSSVWYFARNEVIKQTQNRRRWRGELPGDHFRRLEALTDCRIAVLTMRRDQNR